MNAGLRDRLDRLAAGADVLAQCCYLASAEMSTEHVRRLAQHTMACADTVGKIASKAEVARDFSGCLIVGKDLIEIEV